MKYSIEGLDQQENLLNLQTKVILIQLPKAVVDQENFLGLIELASLSSFNNLDK